MIRYEIEIIDLFGRRIGRFDEAPLLEATRSFPDAADHVEGMLPLEAQSLYPGLIVRVKIDGRIFCETPLTEVAAQWGDSRKLILDKYINFHEVLNVVAEQEPYFKDGRVKKTYANEMIGDIVKSLIDCAPGPIHYTVAHGAYPEGAQREYAKFMARKNSGNELEAHGISRGDWTGPGRINASGAFAKDGDTISGLVVDGIAWPDVRLLMIDCEETAKNSHAARRHPEVAEWSAERYANSGYKLRADAATNALQELIGTDGIQYIELNPHRGADGAYDDRVDRYGRYIALVYGGGKCFNAAQVERGHADVYLWEDGEYHAPEMELKDYFSYAGANVDSIEPCSARLCEFDVDGGVFEMLTALCYAAGGYVWSIGPDLRVRFRKAEKPDHVVYYDPLLLSASFGAHAGELCNTLYFSGNPLTNGVSKTYRRTSSQDKYGVKYGLLDYFPIGEMADADKLAEGALDDLAYPNPEGYITFYRGATEFDMGDVIELRGAPICRIDPALTDEWGGRYAGRIVGRIASVTHRFAGSQVSTTLRLTSPLRSVTRPLSVMVRNQDSVSAIYQFRLDDKTIGLDSSFHAD